MDQYPIYVYQSFGGGGGSSDGGCLGGRKRMRPSEARWLADKLAAAGYVVIIISELFGGLGSMRSNDFVYLTEPRRRHILSLVETYSVGDGALYF